MILFLSCEKLDLAAGSAIQIAHSRDYKKAILEYVIPRARIFHVARMNGSLLISLQQERTSNFERRNAT